MNRTEAVLPALALAALLLGTVGTAGAATPGFAAYSVQFSYMGMSHTVTVNESVSATSNVHYDKLTLSVASGNSTFTYTRSINSSLDVSPFLPSVTNQSLNYASGSTSASVSVLKNGSTPVTFDGKSYGLTSYAVKADVSSNGTTEKINAAVLTFASGLVYSVKVSAPIPSLQGMPSLAAAGLASQMFNSTMGFGSFGAGASPFLSLAAAASGTATLTITLLSTSLPLSGPAPSMTEQVASIGIGAGAVVSVLALGLGVRHRHKHATSEKPQPKPEYSVD